MTVDRRDGRRPVWLSRGGKGGGGTGRGPPRLPAAHWSEEKSFSPGCILKGRPTGCANKLDVSIRERSQG